MNAIQKLVVSKAIKGKDEKTASKATNPGDYDVDVTVRIHGKLRKGEDFQKTQPNTIKWSLLTAILASKVNDETLDAVLREYADTNGEHERLEAEIKVRAQSKIDELKGMTTITAAGPVTTDLAVEVVTGTVTPA